jgi:hypothetical protein
MLMRYKIVCLFFSTLLFYQSALAQNGEQANVANGAAMSANSMQASKMANNQVNLFTGRPEISVPIHSYSKNGIAFNVSVEYSGAGGIQVGETPSLVGLGWYLNAGGAITRTVKGMPDDLATNGYLYTSALPTDFRADAGKYYYDSIDCQQDIFQFNYPGGSGKFLIGTQSSLSIPMECCQ